MDNPKLNSIALGLKYSEEVLLYRQLKSDIENKSPTEINENEREYLLLKFEEGKVLASNRTRRNLFDNLTSEQGFPNLEKELTEIKAKIDLEKSLQKSKSTSNELKREQSIGSYFYIAAVIALLNFVISEIGDSIEKANYLKRFHSLFKKASEYSKSLAIKPPKINEKRFNNGMNIESFRESLRWWFISLKKKALYKESEDTRFKLVIRGLLKGIPYVGNAIDALLFGK